MFSLLLAVGLLLASGCAALLTQKSYRWSTGCAVGGVVTASLLGVFPSVRVLLGAPAEALHLPWNVPYGAFFVEVDALSAFFLLPIFVLAALAAVYGADYLRPYRKTRSLGPSWFFFNLLVASMAIVVIARNAVLFLVAWEAMALASFFLVTFEDEKESVRDAGWVYLVATHLGTAFLLAFFIKLGSAGGSLDFDQFTVAPAQTGLLFVLALVGFGTKAGFMPLHVWLPEAHPAAPSHVSALMSGVMIKTGIYGLLRALILLHAFATPPLWWGWLLCAVGLLSGVAGILLALAQRDLKRTLAYSSVENIGIVGLGLGVGLLGLSTGSPTLAVLGFAGGLLHIWNHAVFKGLLFFAAGAVAHATGTRDIEHLGGLLKRLPWTGALFLTGAAAICGLPPLNGFVSEFLIYVAALHGVTAGATATAVAVIGVVAGLALIGGLAAASFTRVFGITFLGEPRSDVAAHAHEPGVAMRLPMLLLAACCLLIGLFAPVVVGHLTPLLVTVSGLSADVVHANVAPSARLASFVATAGVALLLLVALLAGLRCALLSGRQVDATVTWDCGYAQPTARMQYTASSFAQPLTDLFGLLLQTRRRLAPPTGFFPRAALLVTDTPDLTSEHLYRPVFTGIGRGLARLRWLQHGRVHLYVLYIALTLLVLFVWKLG
jgi:hydrogenase-4 component B